MQSLGALLAAGLIALSVCARAGEAVSAKGLWLAHELDAMGVETKWIAGHHIDWRTGEPDGRPERSHGRHTHCSAFVAAFAQEIGVYILRPPEHGQVLLANAQNEWLEQEGAQAGWRRLSDAIAAQASANAGELVVASYHNRRDDKPGHIAIIKPAALSPPEIEADGPMSIQAGTVNSAAIRVRLGFSGHVHAWNDDEIDYYAHAIPASPAN
jgi:hypothetical protein